MSEEPQNPLQV